MQIVADLTLVVAAALAGGFLARLLGQPLVVGYVIAGVVVGPFTGGLTVDNVDDIEQLAEIGVAFLLFSTGLELSLRELKEIRGVALGGTILQMLLTIALGVGLGAWFGWDWPTSIWFGALISFLSTVVALKTVHTQGRLGTLSSRVMVGILLVQDLAVVPLTILLPALSNLTGPRGIGIATIRAVGLLAIIVWIATRFAPWLLARVAQWNSRELFLLATSAIALGVGYATFAFGLSFALGAFVAGLVLTESEYAHQALSDVVPLRDLFGMLFFVSVGMLLDPAQVWAHRYATALVLFAVVVGKAAILSGLVRLFGYRNVVPLAVGLTLFQVGEFAFVLARIGLSSGALSDDVYALVLNTTILTMVLTPIVSGLVPALYGRVKAARRSREPLDALNLPAAGLSNHVIVCGAGRVGRSIGDALAHLGLQGVLIELDDHHVRQARAAGLPVIYGDASQMVVLEAAAIHRARAMVVTVPTFVEVRNIVSTARRLQSALPIIARADGPDAIHGLYELGVEEVTSPEFEAGIEMTRQALAHLDVPAHDILRVATHIRRERYGVPVQDPEAWRAMAPLLGEVTRQLDFTWLRVPSGSPFDGRTLADLQLRSTIGAAVVGVLRDGQVIVNPDGATRLADGDVVAVLGTREQISQFERAVQPGS